MSGQTAAWRRLYSSILSALTLSTKATRCTAGPSLSVRGLPRVHRDAAGAAGDLQIVAVGGPGEVVRLPAPAPGERAVVPPVQRQVGGGVAQVGPQGYPRRAQQAD